MNQRRLRIGGPREERIPRHIIDDHDWVHDHHDQLIQQFGECYLIVYKGQVLGTGATSDEALDNADRNLPPEMNDLPVMVEWVGNRFPVSLRRSKRPDENAE